MLATWQSFGNGPPLRAKELRGNRRMGGEDFSCMSCYARRLGMTEAGGAGWRVLGRFA